jgi:predicted Ser/Thr protein kinase
VVVAILLLLFFIFRRRRQQHRPMLVPQNSKLAVPLKDQGIELGNHTSVRLFSLKELDLATNHFSDLIGEGSFGPVFLGRLADRSEVAIKRRADTSKMGTDSFLNEVNLLSQVHHPNLVELLGYHTSYEKQNPVQMLVYEYMPGGTLMDHLYGMPLIIYTF